MDVRDANILVHSTLASCYNEREPHFRPENRAKVRSVLESLRAAHGPRLLDVGCGTGFVIDLAADLFDEIHGVDITPAMMARIDASRAHVHLHEADAAAMPFEADRFDVVSAYAFFHHLQDLEPVLREIHRVLRPGGGLYADLEPNRHFWAAISSVRGLVGPGTSTLVTDEIGSVCHTDDRVADEFGIPQDVFNLAEYNKSITGGIDPDEFTDLARRAGFASVTATYQWYAGQGKILHGVSAEVAEAVDRYLREALPLSRGLFKYLRFVAVNG